MKHLALIVVVLVLSCGSPIHVVRYSPQEWGDTEAGEMPDPATFCPPSKVHGECLDQGGTVFAVEVDCMQRYRAEAWKRSKARAEAKGMTAIPAERAMASLRDRDRRESFEEEHSEFYLDQGEGPLHPLTANGKANHGDTMVVEIDASGESYLATREGKVVLVVPEDRQRETRTVNICPPRCPPTSNGQPDDRSGMVYGLLLPAGSTFGGVVKVPRYSFKVDPKFSGKTSWTPAEIKANDCPPNNRP